MASRKPTELPDWEERYRQPGYFCGTRPTEFLQEHFSELPRGAALDLAMGEGRNALFLAQQGFSVTGIEKSPTAVAKARKRAHDLGVALACIQADLENYALPVEQYDVVLCFNYLQRNLFPAMVRALKPGGALMMETYTIEQAHAPRGPRNPAHLLQPNELYYAFRDLRVAYYREVVRGERAVASLLAYKRRD